MRTIGWTAALAGLVLAAAGAGRADDAADPKAVVEKAIKATGGADLLKKYQAWTIKAKGKFYGMGDGIEYTSEQSVFMPDKLHMKIDAGNFQFLQVFNGDKGWIVAGENTMELGKEAVEEAQEELYVSRLTHLVPLLEDGCKLSPLGEIKVDGKAAVGVRAEHKGHRDVSLYFDKDSGLLARVERRGKDVMGGGGEYTAEATYGDYKKVEGVQVPYKVTIKRDGKRFIEAENNDVKLFEKLDSKLFEKPQ
jgi:hypothetical protein